MKKIIRNPDKELSFQSQRKNKRGRYDGDIYNITLAKGIFDLSKYHLNNIRKDQLLRNCVKPETGLHILSMAFKTRQVTLGEV